MKFWTGQHCVASLSHIVTYMTWKTLIKTDTPVEWWGHMNDFINMLIISVIFHQKCTSKSCVVCLLHPALRHSNTSPFNDAVYSDLDQHELKLQVCLEMPSQFLQPVPTRLLKEGPNEPADVNPSLNSPSLFLICLPVVRFFPFSITCVALHFWHLYIV